MIVIDDSGYALSPLAVFYIDFRLSDQASRSLFTVGKRVGFTVNTDGEIIELWLE